MIKKDGLKPLNIKTDLARGVGGQVVKVMRDSDIVWNLHKICMEPMGTDGGDLRGFSVDWTNATGDTGRITPNVIAAGSYSTHTLSYPRMHTISFNVVTGEFLARFGKLGDSALSYDVLLILESPAGNVALYWDDVRKLYKGQDSLVASGAGSLTSVCMTNHGEPDNLIKYNYTDLLIDATKRNFFKNVAKNVSPLNRNVTKSMSPLYDGIIYDSNFINLGSGQFVNLTTVQGDSAYYDPALKTFVKIAVSAGVYKMTQAFSMFFSVNKTITAADISYLNKNLIAVVEMHFGKLIPGLSFLNAEVKSLYPANRGLTGADLVIDLKAMASSTGDLHGRNTFVFKYNGLQFNYGYTSIDMRHRSTEDFIVDWGDNTSQIVAASPGVEGKIGHRNYKTQEYTMEVTGTGIQHIAPTAIYNYRLNRIVSIDKFDIKTLTSLYKAFGVSSNITDYKYSADSELLFADLRGMITINVTDFTDCFAEWAKALPADIKGLDEIRTDAAVTLEGMFAGWEQFTAPIDLSNFNTSNSKSFKRMFGGWINLLTPLDVTGFDIANSEDLSEMFGLQLKCTTSPDVSGFDTAKTTDMNAMFYRMEVCTTVPDVSGFDVSKVTSFSKMFEYNKMYPSFPNVSSWVTNSAVNFNNTFHLVGSLSGSCSTSLDVSSFNMSDVVDIDSMFHSFVDITTPPDVSAWDTASCTTMRTTFAYMYKVTSAPDVSNWDTSSCTDMRGLFTAMNGILTGGYPDLHNFDTSKVERMDSMLQEMGTLPGSHLGSVPEIGIKDFDISSLVIASSFMNGTKFETSAIYDDVLNAWGDQAELLASFYATLIDPKELHFGSSKYTDAGLVGRNKLVAAGWILNDGGHI